MFAAVSFLCTVDGWTDDMMEERI